MSAAHGDVGPTTIRPEFVLELRDITAGYGRVMVLRSVDLAVRSGTVVALLGPNGAGKTTLLRVAAGLLLPAKGTIWVHGADLTKKTPHQRVQAGLCLIPDGRGVFPSLTVKENLRLAVPPGKMTGGFAPALDVFPILERRLGQKAATLSGGEQRILALARCYLAGPSLVLLDEVSLGLSPRLREQIFDSLTRLTRTGVSLLLVEQYVNRALELADVVYLLNHGTITFSGPSADLDEAAVLRDYLGVESDEGARGRGSHTTPERRHEPTPRSTQKEES